MNAGPQLERRPIARFRQQRRRPLITNHHDAAWAAEALADGAVVAHGFANLYAMTARADEETVRRVNLLKGRPPTQVGSITVPPAAVADGWDLNELPDGLTRSSVLRVVDTFFRLGPFGFRGPAAANLPAHLISSDHGVLTTQVIAPGYACPSNVFLELALRAVSESYLFITSANRSRHLTGQDDSPAHWKAAGLLAEFGEEEDLVVLEHDNEDTTRQRYPQFLPMSTTILAFHSVRHLPNDPRPHLVLERQGSLHADIVRLVLNELGFGLFISPQATSRLEPRDYLSSLCDR